MEKKNYVKPSMKVVKVRQHMLLVDSNHGEGHIPNMCDDEMNKLA
jgi:hypothetical protein